MPKVYLYVVDRDFGFAPNPFHGCCSLATCKAAIRARAQLDDWVIGLGGSRLRAPGRCVFAMRVSECMTFDEYWANPAYLDKRPIRNGSRRMMVGDNIYHRESGSTIWHQADSHHSNVDGSPNPQNLATDTKADRVLVSKWFYYFGSSAPLVPQNTLATIGYRNGRHYRVYPQSDCQPLLEWLDATFHGHENLVLADPFDFERSERRYSAGDNRIR